MARILLNTFGSFGDLHPFLAIAIELQRRGHTSVIATSEVYRQKVEAEGVAFAPVRPDVGEMLHDSKMLAKLWHPSRGTEYLLRDYLMPAIEESYQDLAQAVIDADLLLTHAAAYAGPIVAESHKLPWLSLVLQPSIFLSACDPPILPVTWLRHLYPLGRKAVAGLFAMGKARVRLWAKPLLALRSRLGLSTQANPVFEGVFSPYGSLALFSEHFAAPQADWPPHVITTGFVYYDQLGRGFNRPVEAASQTQSERLAEFLESGPAPILFTLGSSAVMHPGTFFRESAKAAQLLGARAVLLTGNQPLDEWARNLPDSILLADYAPYSTLMPRAAVIVHQGGIGTTAQAMLAGKPTLVVPWSHDQPDNANRLERLGVSRTLNRARYTAAAVRNGLQRLMNRPEYTEAAFDLRTRLLAEDGLRTACDAIEAKLTLLTN